MNNKDYLKSSAANDILRVSLPKPRLSKEISHIYMKHKRSLQYHRAMIPTSMIARYCIPSTAAHIRYSDRFEKLYDTSPRKKKEKLRQARLKASMPGLLHPPDGMFFTEFKYSENRKIDRKPSRCSSARYVRATSPTNEPGSHRLSVNLQKSEHSLAKAVKAFEKENSHVSVEASRCLRHQISRNIEEIKNVTQDDSLYSQDEKRILTKSFHNNISKASVHHKNLRSMRHSSVPRQHLL
jgi:hypothetical protein